MYVCTYVCMYVCTYVCMYICMCIYTYVCTVCMYVCMYVYMQCMYVCLCTCVCMFVCMCVCMMWKVTDRTKSLKSILVITPGVLGKGGAAGGADEVRVRPMCLLEVVCGVIVTLLSSSSNRKASRPLGTVCMCVWGCVCMYVCKGVTHYHLVLELRLQKNLSLRLYLFMKTYFMNIFNRPCMYVSICMYICMYVWGE